jgi:hypothetical protein
MFRFNTRQVGVTHDGQGYVPIYAPIVTRERSHQERIANLDRVTIHVTDNTVRDNHPVRRMHFAHGDLTPRKERLMRERSEAEQSIKLVASAVSGAIILAVGIIAGFCLSSIL